MKRGEAKLSQFAGVILLILFFVFSLLYLMIFQSVDDVLRATMSVNQKVSELKCDAVLNSFLSSEYYKGGNEHLITISCSSLGGEFTPYNLTHCLNVTTMEESNPDIQRGDFEEVKTEASLLSSWYELPGIVITPNCEGLTTRKVVVLIFESGNFMDYLIFDVNFDFNIEDIKDGDEVVMFRGEPEMPSYSISNESGSLNVNVRFERRLEEISMMGGVDDYDINVYDLKYETLPNLTCSYELKRIYGISTYRDHITNVFWGGGLLVEEKPFEYCFESYVGECPIGFYMDKDYYYLSAKLSEFTFQVKKFSDLNIFAGISFGPPAIDIGRVSQFCYQPILSVYQRGDSLVKEVRDAQAYVGWG